MGGHDSLAPAGAMSIQHRLSHRLNSYSHNQGIFDRAMKKIEKEETDKQEAVEFLRQQKEEEEQLEKRKAAYEKNYARAEQQAQQMLQSATEDAKITASSELSDMFGLNNAFQEKIVAEHQQEVTDQEREQRGFLGAFNVKMDKITKQPQKQDELQNIQQKNQAIIDLHSTIQNEVAPNIVNQAVSEALNIKGQDVAQDDKSNSMKRMKDKMNAKLNQQPPASQPQVAAAPQQPAEEHADLQAFNKIPLTKVSASTEKQMQEDSVSSFLHQADKQEKEEQAKQEKEKQEEEQRQKSYDAAVSFGQNDAMEEYGQAIQQPRVQPQESYEVPEDNPISAMMALKHPEQQKAIMDESTMEMAQSHYSSLSSRSSNVF